MFERFLSIWESCNDREDVGVNEGDMKFVNGTEKYIFYEYLGCL